ncbi:SDR family NAD(P)-dependent oxidoreductase [Microbacterium sp. RD1]|uniref:SDR family NAD(P)-dependent oxidoreductase n=1 Tax=Microbacterium sp. RD1 TaxID=3457313 RepID=UPI003FA6085C
MTDPKVHLVTGALGGIGRSAARLLAESGAHVVVTDLVDAGGADFADELSALGAEVAFRAADLTDEDQVRDLVAWIIGRFGRLDGAFNNAGIAQHEKPLVELTSAEFDRVMRVNVLGTFHCVKYEMRAMVDGGSIVNTSSGLGALALPDKAEYITSKHAVNGLTRAAAVEGGPLGIRVNALLPGSIRTPMQESLFGELDGPAVQQRAAALHLLGRMGDPDEIGRAARWLLSDEASFVTGALFAVDGGVTAGRRL